MRVLVACEFSGIVRDAFSKMGHDAVSCDLLPSDRPGKHYQGDVLDILDDNWDIMIAHPDCTYICSSGLHWNGRIPGREAKTKDAIEFVRRLMDAPIGRIAIEAPVGRIGTVIRPAEQIVQPYNFGHDASKRTCLWLKNLPRLRPTSRIAGRIIEWPRGSGRYARRWANQTDSGQNRLAPSEDRWMERAKTYQGLADAMAAQWGCLEPVDPEVLREQGRKQVALFSELGC